MMFSGIYMSGVGVLDLLTMRFTGDFGAMDVPHEVAGRAWRLAKFWKMDPNEYMCRWCAWKLEGRFTTVENEPPVSKRDTNTREDSK